MKNRGHGNQHEFGKLVSPQGRQPVIPTRGTMGLNANNQPKVPASAIRNPFQRKQG